MPKKVFMGIGIVMLIYFIASQPQTAAAIVRNLGDFLLSIVHGLGQFVSSLVQGR